MRKLFPSATICWLFDPCAPYLCVDLGRQNAIRFAVANSKVTKACGVKAAVMFAAAVLIAACGTESVAIVGAGVASFIHTDKFPTDYIGELATGKQCDTLAAIRTGAPFCHDPVQVFQRPLYCYRSLGAIECYATPDPYGTGAQQVK